MSQLLHSKLSGVRGRLTVVSAATGIAGAVAALVILIAVQMLLDFNLLADGLPWSVRAAFLAFDIAFIAFILFRYTLYPLLFGPDDDEIALMVERDHPQFKSRLICAIQLIRPNAVPAGASASLVRAMLAETESIARPMDFRQVVKSDRLTKFSAAAVLLVIFGAATVVYTKDVSGQLLKRFLLGNNDVPRKTRISPATQTKIVARGDNLSLAVIVDGVVPTDPAKQHVLIKYTASGREQEFLPDRAPDAWTATLANVEESFRYRFSFDGVVTPYYNITVDGDEPMPELLDTAASTTQPQGIEALCLSGSNTIPRGGNVILAATCKGRPSAVARINIWYKSGKQVDEVDGRFDWRHDVPTFTRGFENIQESFKYRFLLNDGASPWQEVQALPRPSVSKITCTQIFPAYTTKPPTPRLPGDLSLLAGSTLKLQITANKNVRSGYLTLSGMEGRIDAAVDPKNPTQLTAEFNIPADKLNGFSVHLTDENRIDSRDEAIYRIDIVPDKPPVVHITTPDRSDILQTQKALFLIRYEVSDDFGIQKLQLHYTVDKNGEQAQTIELPIEKADPAAGPPTSIRGKYDWNLGLIQPLAPEGSVVTFWIEATDNNNVTANGGKGVSDHFTIKIVSQAEFNQDQINQLNEKFSQIQSTTTDQETTSDMLGNILLGRPATRPTTPVPPQP